MGSGEIDKARAAAARDPAQRVRLVDLLVAEGQASDAIATCQEGLSLMPSDIPLRLALGRALSAAGRLTEAQQVILDVAAHQEKEQALSTRAAEPSASFDDAPTHFLAKSDNVSGRYLASLAEDESDPMRLAKTHSTQLAKRGGTEAVKARTAALQALLPELEIEVESPANGAVNLDLVAERLLATGNMPLEGTASPVGGFPRSTAERRFDRRRSSTFLWLWAGLGLLTVGILSGYLYRQRVRAKQFAAMIALGDERVTDATAEGDLAARDAYATVLRAEPDEANYFAMVALAQARLAAEHGEDTEAAGWSMLRRAERQAGRGAKLDGRAQRELRQARALLALSRGEACTPVDDQADGEIAARCALQRGDLDSARRILRHVLLEPGGAENVRALLGLATLEFAAGDLDTADSAFAKVLSLRPKHPRALVGRALTALERGERPSLTLPAERIGVTTLAWYHLALGLIAEGRRGGRKVDDGAADHELELAEKGLVHDGHLALMYGRARLQDGQVALAEQAMRIAQRLEPSDPEVLVLDAEVALTKGYEAKVLDGLAAGPQSPRKEAVLGRALCLAGMYKEALVRLASAIEKRPGDATAVTYHAIARAHLGDLAGATRELERAAETLPSTTAHYGLGLLAYERQDLSRAQAEVSLALEGNPEAFRARTLLGRILADAGKLKEGITMVAGVARDAPDFIEAHALLSELYLRAGREREARLELLKVADKRPLKPSEQLDLAEAVIRLGLPDEGQIQLAKAGSGERRNYLGLLLSSFKPKEALIAAKGLEKLHRGPVRDGKDARWALDVAAAFRRAGDSKRAEARLREAVPIDPLHAQLELARIFLGQGLSPSAETAARAALAAWQKGKDGIDDLTDARIVLGRALLGERRAKDAVAELESAAGGDPSSAEAHLFLAHAYQDSGERARARSSVERAVELDPQYAAAELLLGELLRGSDPKRAKEAFRRVVELDGPTGASGKIARHFLLSAH